MTPVSHQDATPTTSTSTQTSDGNVRIVNGRTVTPQVASQATQTTARPNIIDLVMNHPTIPNAAKENIWNKHLGVLNKITSNI